MLRVRFAPSPTGFLHVGSARTFIFNWLYARRNGGTMVLRLDDTDVERNTDASVNSIFEGLRWLDLGWDEEYKQSERLALHRQIADAIFQKGLAYRDFTPAHTGDSEKSGRESNLALQSRHARAVRAPRATGGPRPESPLPFASAFRRGTGEQVRFNDAVYGEQIKSADDIEDFALLRSDGMPTYHLASCADDIDLRISHIIRGQDHLSNTYKHVLIFEGAGAKPPQFAHLPLLVAPDGSKLSKRRHGPVVSVTTYRDAGFLPEAFINFLCLLGWSPKDDREKMTRQELIDAFSLEGINRANAVVNFKESAATPDETFDPKALWLNAEHIRGLSIDELSAACFPLSTPPDSPSRQRRCTPSPRSSASASNFCATSSPPPTFSSWTSFRPTTQPSSFRRRATPPWRCKVLTRAREVLAQTEFKHDPLDQALRAAAQEMGSKAGQMFQPIRVAVCGRKNAPPLFETLEVLERETTLARIDEAIKKL